MVTAALHQFGAVCYIRSGTTSPKSSILAARRRAEKGEHVSGAALKGKNKRSFWKRLFRS
jgi:hypothetical protein